MPQAFTVTREIAAKVLEVVDAGLVKGLGSPKPGHMCIEAAVCYALGQPHGDEPTCVSPAVRCLKIRLNDSRWSSNEARAKGLRRLAIAQLGTAGVIDDRKFAKRAAEVVIRKMVPFALRAAAAIQKDAEHRDALCKAAAKCERDGARKAAREARAAATAAGAAAGGAASYAADAAGYAAAAAADAAADAAGYGATAAGYAAAAAAAAAADYAGYAAAAAADYAARDKALSEFAESIVQVLVDMKAPACEFLDLAEAA